MDHGYIPSPSFMSSSDLLGLGVVSSATLSRVSLDRARLRTTVRAIPPSYDQAVPLLIRDSVFQAAINLLHQWYLGPRDIESSECCQNAVFKSTLALGLAPVPLLSCGPT